MSLVDLVLIRYYIVGNLICWKILFEETFCTLPFSDDYFFGLSTCICSGKPCLRGAGAPLDIHLNKYTNGDWTKAGRLSNFLK